METVIITYAETANALWSAMLKKEKVRRATKVKRPYIPARIVTIVQIKANASKETTVKHPWKNGLKILKHPKCSIDTEKKIWKEF